jgi:N-acetylated-alpha-linked acidic dipeptidase
VENIASNIELSRTPNFDGLRSKIKHLQHTSARLDDEKVKAEVTFKKALKKVLKYQREHKSCGSGIRRARRFIKHIFGVDHEQDAVARAHQRIDRLWARVFAAEGEYGPKTDLEDVGGELDEILRKFIRAAIHVRRVNQKLIAFERGFIDEAGIKDREWYRHLGVAPGKWKGEFIIRGTSCMTHSDGLLTRIWRDYASGSHRGFGD